MPRVTREAVQALLDLPFPDLLFRAQTTHREHHDAAAVQRSTLLSVKTGGCAEDCGYCAQSARWSTGLAREPLMALQDVVEAARDAKASGSSRFCMGAAWRRVRDDDLPALEAMVSAVAETGLETCMTLGTLRPDQAERLAGAGLDYYNHNLDTSRERYGDVITTRSYDERLDTIAAVRQAGMKVCCGGILGMGEAQGDRAALIATLASMEPPPESVPINKLVPVPGTPLADRGVEPVNELDFVRVIAAARVVMPRALLRLSAGRESMSEALQALCFLAGANSIFSGEKLLTTRNRGADADSALLERLGMSAI